MLLVRLQARRLPKTPVLVRQRYPRAERAATEADVTELPRVEALRAGFTDLLLLDACEAEQDEVAREETGLEAGRRNRSMKCGGGLQRGRRGGEELDELTGLPQKGLLPRAGDDAALEGADDSPSEAAGDLDRADSTSAASWTLAT